MRHELRNGLRYIAFIMHTQTHPVKPNQCLLFDSLGDHRRRPNGIGGGGRIKKKTTTVKMTGIKTATQEIIISITKSAYQPAQVVRVRGCACMCTSARMSCARYRLITKKYTEMRHVHHNGCRYIAFVMYTQTHPVKPNR